MSWQPARITEIETNRAAADDSVRLWRARHSVACELCDKSELTPARCARLVARTLTRRSGARLLCELRRAGWLRADFRPSFDVLDGASCPTALRGALREPARLALFGPGGQGSMSDARHAEAIFQRFRSEILREARDYNGLNSAAHRALHHPEVAAHPEVERLLRAFIAECEADLRSRLEEQRRESELVPRDQLERLRHPGSAPPASAVGSVAPNGDKLDRAVPAAGGDGAPSTSQILTALERMQHEFDDALVHFDVARCRQLLTQTLALQSRYAANVPESRVERFRSELARLEARRGEILAQIEQLSTAARRAAQSGDSETVTQSLQRLSSLHAARPYLFTEEHFRKIRDQIDLDAQTHEHHAAARELLARERAVSAEIRQIAESIRVFHRAVRDLPHVDERFRTAEAAYRLAVRGVKSHDREWLAGLILELDALLDTIHDASHQAESQVDKFLASVRAALSELAREIIAIEHETRRD
ncbi:MAG: hypothetical protein U1D55_06105 [Phycisphaerae bacterium]